MAGRLRSWVHLRDPQGRPVVFGPSDEVPAWAAELITNPAAWAVDVDSPLDPPEDEIADEHAGEDVVEHAGDDEPGQVVDEDSAEDLPMSGGSEIDIDQASMSTPAPAVEVPPAAPAVGDHSAEAPPPRSGRGSGRDVWAGYASRAGLDPTGLDREEILEALRDAKVAT